MYNVNLFTDLLSDEIANSQESQPLSISFENSQLNDHVIIEAEASVSRGETQNISRPAKGTGQYDKFRSVEEIDIKYRSVFSYPFFNLVQSSVIEDALYSDKSMVVCAPTGSGKTVVFEMAIVQLMMELEDKQYTDDFKIIYMAPVKALCTERLTEWYPKFTKLGLLCIEVTGDTDVDFSQLKPYRIIITTPEKWDMVTRRWREHSQLVEVIKLFLIDEVHILNDETRGPVLEAVVSRMKTIEASAQSAHRIQQLQNQYQGTKMTCKESPPKIRFVAVSATVSNPGDVADWLGTADKPAVYYKFGDESRPVKLKRIVEGYPCPEGTSIFKFDIILNYKLWPVIQKYHNGKPTLIFCNTRKSVALTAETLSRELTVSFSPEQKSKLTALASTIKNKKLQMLVLSGVGCHHAGLLYEERNNIERAFRNRDLPILITTTTLAMGVNLPAHLVIIKNTQQYVNGAYQEYSISTILQMVGRAGRPQFDTEATAVIMTRLCDKPRYQALVGGGEPLQSYLHKRLAENLNSEAALGTVNDVAQCVQWVRSTFLSVRAARDPKRYLGLPQTAPQQHLSKKIEELCVKAMNGLASSGLITMDEASCIESTEAGRLMSVFYLDLETMKHIMKVNGTETLERLLWIICESHELADMHLRVDERRCLNTLNRNNAAATIRFPMKGKISTRQMKLNCIIQAILGCLNIPDPSLNQEAMKIMRIALRVCKCLVAYVTRPALIAQQPKYYSAVLNSLILAKCITAHLWENSPYVSKQLKGIGPTFSALLASAGKVNFMVLEESHPRDLERIMNKGPPAGNILRKQVGLLPKYQLTMTPIDEKSVTIQLTLLNRNYLSENTEQLTAGDTHKSYMVVGDSDNNLLMLTSFMDKDLVGVYDGVITHQITRKHNFEHSIFVHCISSSFVGVDAQCEYLFKGLDAAYPSYLNANVDFVRKPATKQTNITDTFKERKRKNASENDIGQSKEKKKRDNVLLEKIKSLKESFGKTSRELKEDLNKSAVMSNKTLHEFTPLGNPRMRTEITSEQTIKKASIEQPINNPNFSLIPNINIYGEQINSEENSEMDDEKINSILIEIENEISRCNNESDLPRVDLGVNKNTGNLQSSCSSVSSLTYFPAINNDLLPKHNKARKAFNSTKKHSQKNNRSNYNFIDLLNKNVKLSDEEDELVDDASNGFSDTIKKSIEEYLQHTKTNLMVPDKCMTDLLEVSEQDEKHNKDISDENTKIEFEVTDFNVSTAVSFKDETNDLPRIDNISLAEVEEKNLSENFTINDGETKNIQSRILEANQIVEEDISNNWIIEIPNRTETYITEKPTPIQLLNPLSQIIRKKNYENIQKQNNYKASVPYIDPNLAYECDYEKNQSENNLPRLTLHTNSYEENRSTFFQLPTEQYQPIELLKNRDTQDQIICPNKTDHYRTDVNCNVPELCVSHPEVYSAMSSENSANYNNSPKPYNEYTKIRKYSYSATKIDVASKEDRVTVIRKIKMDVDITEFIDLKDRDNKKYQDGQYNEIDEKNKYRNNQELKWKYFGYLEPYCADKENKSVAVVTIRQQGVNNSKKNNEQNYEDKPAIKCVDFEMHEPHFQMKSNKTALIAYDIKNNVDDDEADKYIQDVFKQQNDEDNFVSPKHKTVPAKLSPQFKLTEYKSIDSDKVGNDYGHDKPKHKNKSPQKESDRLGNILQKYSKILRKNNEENLSQTPTQHKDLNKNYNNAPSGQPKRPFKITEIHHLKTPLLKLQLSETAKREKFDETIDKTPDRGEAVQIQIFKELNKENICTQEVPYEFPNIPETKKEWQEFSQNRTNNAQDEEKADGIKEELSKFKLEDSVMEELEPHRINIDYNTKTDFNIDQSMLNPKTLLQCFNIDETDIFVPPPPEFCDETEPTPQDATAPMDWYEPIRWENFHGNNPKESIFQDDSNIELTPRKETETWTLSQNDENDENLPTPYSFQSRQSFTTMHNPKQCSSPFQNVPVSGRNALGQFKFSRKKKLIP